MTPDQQRKHAPTVSDPYVCTPHSVVYQFFVPRWFDIYVIELTKLIVRIRGNLSKLERKVIVALVTTDVHARDIIDELYENKVHQ